MFRPHGIACPMEHPPAPLHKGEQTFVLTDISFPFYFYFSIVPISVFASSLSMAYTR